jgi:predicted transcriptional regulator
MKLKHPVTLAIEPEVCAALDQIARAEERSRSWLANRMLRESVAARLAMQQEALDEKQQP